MPGAVTGTYVQNHTLVAFRSRWLSAVADMKEGRKRVCGNLTLGLFITDGTVQAVVYQPHSRYKEESEHPMDSALD